MANPNIVNGFKPVRHKDGTPYAGQHNLYYIPAADGTAIFIGDIVKHAGTSGAAATRVDGVDVEGMPAVIQAAAGDSSLVGVVVGFYPRPDALGTRHRPASTAMIAMVADDRSLIFEVQEDSDTCTISAAEVGLNFDFIVAAGDADSGASGMEIDSSVEGTGTANLRLLRLVPRPGNAIGSNARWEVMILEHFDATPTGV